ncbi:hypothetical protein ACFLTE_08390 [Bacteroidota bacterium]
MNELRIIGINVTDRIKEAGKTQEVLSEFSDIIKIRMGFHELTDEKCSRNALIVLQLKGNSDKWKTFEDKLNDIDGLVIKSMHFNY